MTSNIEHPMDRIAVRPLDFESGKVSIENVIWSETSPFAAIFLNALSVHVPYFERYLIRAMHAAKKHVKDENLKADISAIIGQEAHHARNFIDFNRIMASRYPRIEVLEVHAKDSFAHLAKTHSLKQLVGFTAGYETFTFLAGMIVLANYEEWMEVSNPTIKAMWVWHQVEEIEHGAVAFEVFKYMYGKDEFYRKYMILKALLYILTETLKAYMEMCIAEGMFRSLRTGTKSVWFIISVFARMAWVSLPTFSRKYHPRRHPLVTTQQNKIAVAWRRFTKNGGDPLKIDRLKMQEILNS